MAKAVSRVCDTFSKHRDFNFVGLRCALRSIQVSRSAKLKTLIVMNANWKKSISSTIALILLGIAALYGGPKLLALIIPIGIVVWYGSETMVRGGRN